jgi:hypothetical protein
MAFMRDLLAKGRTELSRITVTAEDTCAAAVHIVGVGDLSILMLKAGHARAAYGANNKHLDAEVYAKTRHLGIWAPNDPLPATQQDKKKEVLAALDEKARIWSSYGELAIKDAHIHRLKRVIEDIDKLAREGRTEEIRDLIDGIPDVDLEEDIAYMSQHQAA